MHNPSADAHERLIATFLDLVQIDSPSGEERACADYCAGALRSAGCAVRFDNSCEATGSDTGNLIAELPGTGPGTLVLSAHLDTVEPGRGVQPVVSDGYIFSAGETVLGADDKAGIAAAIEAVRRLSESSAPHPTLRCVFTVKEEIGLIGAKALDPEDVAGDLCLVLDADGIPGGLVVSAPTHYTFKARFLGRAAHAGVAPEKGISAIAIAADAISKLPIGRLDDQTTANVGSIGGGRATNVITASVDITGECRSLDADKVEELRSQMERTMREAADRHGGGFEIDWTREYRGFTLDEDASVLRTLEQACADAGLVPGLMKTGGGSDANIISALGVPTVALACGMQGVHSIDEQIAIADLEALTRLCVTSAHALTSETVG